MNEQHFSLTVDKLFLDIELWLETTSLDFESQEGILTIFLGPAKQLILSRQAALKEIWLASPFGAFHFHYSDNQWKTKQNHLLWDTIIEHIKRSGFSVNMPTLK